MANGDRTRVAAELLLSVADQNEDPGEALAKWPFPADVEDDDIGKCWHLLSDYANNMDISRRDRGYDERQRKFLRTCAERLLDKSKDM
jgi:hypothetical protein